MGSWQKVAGRLAGVVLLWLSACTTGPTPEESTPAASPTVQPRPTTTTTQRTTTPPPTATNRPTTTASSATPANKVGVHLLLDDGRNTWPLERWPEHLDYAHKLLGDGGYVTELVQLDDLDPTRWQVLMDLCADYRLIPILRLATRYDQVSSWWEAPPADADGRYHTVAETFARFVAELSWPTAAHYVIVGNEPNHGNEWGGRPDPGRLWAFSDRRG